MLHVATWLTSGFFCFLRPVVLGTFLCTSIVLVVAMASKVQVQSVLTLLMCAGDSCTGMVKITCTGSNLLSG